MVSESKLDVMDDVSNVDPLFMDEYEEVEYVPSNRERSQMTGTTKWMIYDYDTPSSSEKINSRLKWKSEMKRMGLTSHKYSVKK